MPYDAGDDAGRESTQSMSKMTRDFVSRYVFPRIEESLNSIEDRGGAEPGHAPAPGTRGPGYDLMVMTYSFGTEAKRDAFVERLEEKGLRKADVVRDSGLNQTYCYELLSGRKSGPKRNKVIMLAFGLHCDLTETQRLLRRAGHAELWSKVERDAIIIHCIQHGRTRLQTDDELFRLGYETLVSEEG